MSNFKKRFGLILKVAYAPTKAINVWLTLPTLAYVFANCGIKIKQEEQVRLSFTFTAKHSST